MRIVDKKLDDVLVIELDCHEDERGYFMEIFSEAEFKRLGIDFKPVQDNCSHSLKKGTVRGLHFQKNQYAQAKLIRCTKGSFYDLATDVRKDSPTFGETAVIKLSEDDHKLVFIPKGFAHGVAILEDHSEYTYKVDALYNGEAQNNGGLSCLYDSSKLDIHGLLGDTELILSNRDIEGVSSSLDTLDTDFIYRRK